VTLRADRTSGVGQDDRVAAYVTLMLPSELLETAAARIAELVAERISTAPMPPSPWLNFTQAMDYLGFSRNKLYKLTASREVPFRKKPNGQRLLFHRDDLDRWIATEYPAIERGRANLPRSSYRR
jgi:excisionase family DNA binding protein